MEFSWVDLQHQPEGTDVWVSYEGSGTLQCYLIPSTQFSAFANGDAVDCYQFQVAPPHHAVPIPREGTWHMVMRGVGQAEVRVSPPAPPSENFRAILQPEKHQDLTPEPGKPVLAELLGPPSPFETNYNEAESLSALLEPEEHSDPTPESGRPHLAQLPLSSGVPPMPQGPTPRTPPLDQILGPPRPPFETNYNDSGEAFAVVPEGGEWPTFDSLIHPTVSEQNFARVKSYMYGEMIRNANTRFIQRLNDKMLSGILSTWDAGVAFENAVEVGAIWDHKPAIQRMLGIFEGDGLYLQEPASNRQPFYDMWSNIHYGFVGRAAGFPSIVVDYAHRMGSDNVGATDIGDIITVRAGMEMFDRYGADMTAEEFARGISGTIDKLEAAYKKGQEVSIRLGVK